jgi:MFS family permease
VDRDQQQDSSGGAHRRPDAGVEPAVAARLRRVMVVSRDRALRRFWISQMVSEMGDWIGLLGIAALLYESTNLALAASASLAALYLPYLFAPWLVGWASKIPPRTLLIGADFLRAGLILLLLVPMPAWALLGLVFLASVPTSIYEATRAAAVPEYAPDDDTREDALVLFQSTQQVASMLGFLLGGAALALIGFHAAIALNAASFFVSGLLLLGVPRLDAFVAATESVRGILRGGFTALTGRPMLRRAVLLSVVSASTIMAGEALVVVYATDFGKPGIAGPFAALMAFISAILGLVLPRWGSSEELMRVSALTMIGGGLLSILAFSLPPGFATGIVAYVGLGIVSAPGALTYVVAVREMAPAIRAPVFAIVQVALMGGQALVAVLAGSLADHTSVGTSIALWQVPTIVFSVGILTTSFVKPLARVFRRDGRSGAYRSARPAPVALPLAAETQRAHAPWSALAPSPAPGARERSELPTSR